jgi:type II secretory pathway component PulF
VAEPDPAIRSRWRGTYVWLGVLAALTLLAWVVLVYYVPLQKRRFDEHGLKLPGLTKTLIVCSDQIARYWYVVLPVVVGGMGNGVVFGRHLFRRPTAGTVFACLSLLALVAVLTVAALALALSEIKLAEGMSK